MVAAINDQERRTRGEHARTHLTVNYHQLRLRPDALCTELRWLFSLLISVLNCAHCTDHLLMGTTKRRLALLLDPLRLRAGLT